MADPLSLAASVIAVAGCGLKLSTTIRAAVAGVRSAADHVNNVARGIQHFSSTLRAIGSFLEKHPSVHSEDAEELLLDIISDCDGMFEEVERMLQEFMVPTSRAHMSLYQRVKFCFKRDDLDYLTTQLESSKSTLSLMLGTLQLFVLLENTKYTSTLTNDRIHLH
jgi:hypothetical protein